MREMLEGASDGRGLDVLTGDYLAELTMLILGKDTMKDASLGYARTFVRQAEECLGLALERGVKLVANAGGLNPAGLADRLREVASGLGLDPRIAHVEGDDVRALATEIGLGKDALTANAYLGGFGIAAALTAGADVVVTGRVTDASLVVGPAVAHFGWTPASYDELAGAVVAGHVLECGTQATGGNFSGFRSLPHDGKPLGFPLAEIAADGSCVITKQDGTGGAVTVDTVTAQLVYEIQSTHYLGPDVTTLLDTVQLTQEGPDRVAVSGVRGQAPPERLKVCVNELGGFRNTVEFVLTGLEIEAKADWVREQLTPALSASDGQLDPHRHAAARRRHRGGRVLPAPVHGDGPPARAGRQGVHRPGRRARAGVLPRLHDDRPAGAAHAVRRLPRGVRRPLGRDAHGRARRRLARGGRGPDRVRDGGAGRGAPSLAVPRTRGLPQPPDAAGHVRARALGRQGRRREPRALGGARRLGEVRRARHLAHQADHPQEGARAGPGGGRPRGRGLRAAQPGRRERADPRPARPGGRRVDAVRPAGQGARRVGPLADRAHPGGAAV